MRGLVFRSCCYQVTPARGRARAMRQERPTSLRLERKAGMAAPRDVIRRKLLAPDFNPVTRELRIHRTSWLGQRPHWSHMHRQKKGVLDETQPC